MSQWPTPTSRPSTRSSIFRRTSKMSRMAESPAGHRQYPFGILSGIPPAWTWTGVRAVPGRRPRPDHHRSDRHTRRRPRRRRPPHDRPHRRPRQRTFVGVPSASPATPERGIDIGIVSANPDHTGLTTLLTQAATSTLEPRVAARIPLTKPPPPTTTSPRADTRPPTPDPVQTSATHEPVPCSPEHGTGRRNATIRGLASPYSPLAQPGHWPPREPDPDPPQAAWRE